MPSRRQPVHLLTAAIMLAVAAACAWGLVPRPVPVDTRVVHRGMLAVRVTDDGVTRIRERHVVRAPLAGRMSRVALEPGDAVRARDTIITTIDPPDPALLDPRAEADAAARVEAAMAIRDLAEKALARARVQVEYTTADLERARTLFPTKAVTHEQLDAAERAWKTALDDVAETEEEIHVAEHLVDVTQAAFVRSRPRREGDPRFGSEAWQFHVTAPVDGRVLRVMRESEGLVEAGAELVEVGDLRDLEAVLDLVSEDAVKVRPGAACEITGWGGLTPLSGRVRTVEPRGFTKVSPLGVEEQRVNVIVDIDVPQHPGSPLGDGFRVEAAITIDAVHDAVLVPLAALFREGDGEAAYVVNGPRARLTPVTTGRRGDREAEVLGGLFEGDRVVAYPGDAIGDGTRVRPREGR